jgi:anti-sigma regulatory factor (Ser/Thr protein kinase)
MDVTSLRAPVSLTMQPGDVLVLVSDGIYEQENPRGEAFGEARVTSLIEVHREASATVMLARVLDAVHAFAEGAPQADDMTIVLLKRQDASVVVGEFDRTIDALDPIVAFTAQAFARLSLDGRLRTRVDLAVEELFTNMVKYGRGNAPVQVRLRAVDGGVEVSLIDPDGDPFDVTQAPDVDIDKPIEERKPGGLGLHLLKRMADRIDYDYAPATRQIRITVRFSVVGLAGRG